MLYYLRDRWEALRLVLQGSQISRSTCSWSQVIILCQHCDILSSTSGYLFLAKQEMLRELKIWCISSKELQSISRAMTKRSIFFLMEWEMLLHLGV